MNKLTVEFEWENANKFEVTAKLNDEDSITIIAMEENGCIGELWGSVEGLLHSYLSRQLKTIGNEMKEA